VQAAQVLVELAYARFQGAVFLAQALA